LNARAQEIVKDGTQASIELVAAPGAVPPAPTAALPVRAFDTAAIQKSVADALAAWATAWMNRDVQTYLDAYSSAFTLANGTTHEAWVAQRKAMLVAATSIKLDIVDPKIVVADSTHATAVFRQHYRSLVYRDTVQKTLEWEYTGGRWHIVKEVSEAVAQSVVKPVVIP